MTSGAAFILLEISTPFVCLRWLLFHHGYKGKSIAQASNSVLLFFTFIFGRVGFQSFVVHQFQMPWLVRMWWYTEGVLFSYKMLLVEMATAVLVNIVLNFYWSYLILRQVYRLLCNGEGENDYCGKEGKKREGSIKGGTKYRFDYKEPQESIFSTNSDDDEEKPSNAYRRRSRDQRFESEQESLVNKTRASSSAGGDDLHYIKRNYNRM